MSVARRINREVSETSKVFQADLFLWQRALVQ